MNPVNLAKLMPKGEQKPKSRLEKLREFWFKKGGCAWCGKPYPFNGGLQILCRECRAQKRNRKKLKKRERRRQGAKV